MYSPTYRTKGNGVPVLSKEEIDFIAERFILDFCPYALKVPQPIDIDSLVLNYLKLKQDFQYLSHCGAYLGMMVFNDTRKVAVYNPCENRAEYISAREGTVIIDNTLLDDGQEHRYRFTMGHEGSHWIVHRPVFSRSSKQMTLFDSERRAVVQCRALSLEGRAKPPWMWDDSDTMEWQANYMASALLMPKSMVFAASKGNKYKELMDEADISEKYFFRDLFISSIAKTFDVSCQAAEIRLKNLGLITRKKYVPAPMFNIWALYE